MSVVISELEHRPAADAGGDDAPARATSVPAAVRIDGEQVLAALRREASRLARLWAD